MKTSIIYLFLLIAISANAQIKQGELLEKALQKFDFIEEKIIEDSDTITYYLKNYKEDKPKKLILFIQGSDASPLFSYKMENDKPTFYRWFLDDYQNIDSTSTFAIIPKPGMEGLFPDEEISIPKKYYENNYKAYRVNQIHQSIEHIVQNHLENPDKIIVYGHSEGAAIAAALALKNDKITHLGFWSGNVLNNFYEFSLFNRIEALKGQQTDSLAHDNIMGLIDWYKEVIDEPQSTALDRFGFTNKRWATYERPPIEELLEIDIPIYTVFGTKDESTPIETAYLIPIQFLEKRKNNLTFEVCIDCNHAYQQQTGTKEINHWDDIFKAFLEWTEKE